MGKYTQDGSETTVLGEVSPFLQKDRERVEGHPSVKDMNLSVFLEKREKNCVSTKCLLLNT